MVVAIEKWKFLKVIGFAFLLFLCSITFLATCTFFEPVLLSGAMFGDGSLSLAIKHSAKAILYIKH